MKRNLSNPDYQGVAVTKKPYLFYSLMLSALEGLILVSILVSSPSSESGFIFGLSVIRFILTISILLSSSALFYLGHKLRPNSQSGLERISALEKVSDWLFLLIFWGFVIFSFLLSKEIFVLILSPFYSVDSISLFHRVLPVFIWLVLVSFQFAAAVFLTFYKTFERLDPKFKPLILKILLGISTLIRGKKDFSFAGFVITGWGKLKAVVVVWGFLLLVWCVVVISKVGLTPDDRFWNIAGVPLLPQQIVFTILGILLFSDIRRILVSRKVDEKYKKYSSIIIPLLIWLIAVLVWQGQELGHTYFAPGPYAPNYVHYPFSDATRFDIGSQYFLLGRGINNGSLTDRPFMILYTSLLHLLGGQEYNNYIFAQIVILAVIPVLVYFNGALLHSKLAGFGMAVLVIYKEKNAINTANQAGIINVKVLMSELPNALLLLIVSLVLILWFRYPKRRSLYGIIIGSAIAVAVGVRGNSLAIAPLIPVIFFLGLFKKRPEWLRSWITQTGLFFLAFILVLIPYSLETTIKYGSPFWLLKVQLVLERSSSIPESPGQFYYTNERDSSIKVSALQKFDPDDLLGLVAEEARATKPASVFDHFIHNEIATIQMYPWDYSPVPLDDFVQKPYWDARDPWKGDITFREGVFLCINLLIFSFGFGYLIRTQRFFGFLPLLIHLIYNLANSIARTSGGRYLVPTDWITHIYFVLGIIVIFTSNRQYSKDDGIISDLIPPINIRKRLIISMLVICLLIGGSYQLSGLITPAAEIGQSDSYLRTLSDSRWEDFASSGVTKEGVHEFITSNNATVSLGMVLYPRLFTQGEESPKSAYIPDLPADEQRLYFQLLTDVSPLHVNLNIRDKWVGKFPNAEYALIIGCQLPEYIQAKMVVPLSEDSNILIENPLELTCLD